jgi:hypothetical protein
MRNIWARPSDAGFGLQTSGFRKKLSSIVFLRPGA